MRRGTTARLVMEVEGTNFHDSSLYVLFRQKDIFLQKKQCELEINPNSNGCTVRVELSQGETIRFRPGKVNMQLRWVKQNGEAYASPIVSLKMRETLSSEVISYG